jgi:hypothetical protein
MNLAKLANAALLGTQRAAPPSPSGHDAVSSLLKDIKGEPIENKLLSLAGTLSLYEEAGTTPPRLKRVIHDLPPQDKPRCRVDAAKLLGRMLNGQHTELLPEFLTALAEAGQRAPEETLPLLLDRARNTYHLRAPLISAMGETGRWLARQNSAWHFADGLTFERVNADWKTNMLLARQGILKQVRTHDAVMGLELINSTWKNESPTDRIWIIKALQLNLSPADEPFLETALDDRSLSVRKIAAELLSVLPESRLSKRMTTLAETMFELREAELFVDFPETTPQMTRDGVGHPLWNDREKVLASQLTDIVSLLPLEFWTRKFKATPATILEAARASIWSKSLLGGLTAAIERQARSDWALALLLAESYNTQTLRVLSVLSPATMDTYIKHLHETLNHNLLLTDNPLLKVMGRWLQPWSETLSDICLTRLQLHKDHAGNKLPDITLESTLKTFARFCPRSFIPRALEELQVLSQHDVFRKACFEPLQILFFRRAMLEEVKS